MNLIKSLFTGAVLMAAAAVSLAEQPMPRCRLGATFQPLSPEPRTGMIS